MIFKVNVTLAQLHVHVSVTTVSTPMATGIHYEIPYKLPRTQDQMNNREIRMFGQYYLFV